MSPVCAVCRQPWGVFGRSLPVTGSKALWTCGKPACEAEADKRWDIHMRKHGYEPLGGAVEARNEVPGYVGSQKGIEPAHDLFSGAPA